MGFGESAQMRKRDIRARAMARGQLAVSLRNAGATFREVGAALGVCGSRAAQIFDRGMRDLETARGAVERNMCLAPRPTVNDLDRGIGVWEVWGPEAQYAETEIQRGRSFPA